MILRSLAAILLLAAGCSSGGYVGGEEDLWMGPPDMSTLDPGVVSKSPATQAEVETHITVAPNGYMAIAYIGLKLRGSTNGYVFSTNEGATFEKPQVLDSPAGREASDPVLAADKDSNIYITWLEFLRNTNGQPYDMHIYVAKSPAGYTGFGPPVEVTNNPQGIDDYDKPWMLFTNDGALLVTYARTSTGGIFAARTKDFTTFTTATIAEDMNFRNLVFPCQPSTGDTLYAVYHAGGGIGLRRSDDGGLTWPDANRTAVAAMGERPAFDDPTCAAEGDEIWVSYGLSRDPFSTSNSAKLDSIRIAHSMDKGMTMDRHTDAHDDRAGVFYLHPYLVREDSGALDLAYYAGQSDGDTAGTFRRARSTDSGVTWDASLAVRTPITYTGNRASSKWLGDYFGATWTRGNLYIAYADNSANIVHTSFYRTALPTQ